MSRISRIPLFTREEEEEEEGGRGRGISITANLLTNFPLVVLRETQGYFVSIYHKQALTSRFMQISLFVEQVARRGNVASVKRDAISFRSFLNIIVWLYCEEIGELLYVFGTEMKKI